MNSDDRMTELEIHVSHLEQTLEELNRVIISQQKHIDKLQSEFSRLEKEFKNASASDINDISKEPPPPHY